jgi:adenylate kinase family enzyme
VSVVGNSGSGKSTLARALARRLHVAHVELDSFKHQPGWKELPADEFAARVRVAIAADGWVVDGNYSTVRDEVWQRADTVVWVDPPRIVVMRQVIGRTLGRLVRRTELWNGNREPWRNLYTLDPQESVIAWAWTRHRHYRELYRRLSADPSWGHLTFHRVASRKDSERLLAGLDPAPAQPGGLGSPGAHAH